MRPFSARPSKDTGVEFLGWLPVRPDLVIPERHLGLTMPESGWMDSVVFSAAVECESYLALDRLLAIARSAPHLPQAAEPLCSAAKSVRIAVARDESFCFYYQDNLPSWNRLAERSYRSARFATACCRRMWTSFTWAVGIPSSMPRP